MTTTETKPKLGGGTGTHWPPTQHIYDKRRYPDGIKEGDEALCGAKVVGIENPDRSWPVCKKCLEILKQQTS